MKQDRIIYLVLLLLALVFTSCEKKDIQPTNNTFTSTEYFAIDSEGKEVLVIVMEENHPYDIDQRVWIHSESLVVVGKVEEIRDSRKFDPEKYEIVELRKFYREKINN